MANVPAQGQVQAPLLRREIGFFGNLAITLSFVTPTASVFVTASVLISLYGSASFVSFIIAAIAGVALAMCFAELGALFPSAGGYYSSVLRILGRTLGFVAFLLFIVEVVLITCAAALGTAQYLGVVWPNLNKNLVGTLVIVAATLIAAAGIKLNSRVTSMFLLLELAAIGTVVVSGLAHTHQPVSLLIHPKMVSGSRLLPVSTGNILAGITLALFAFEGYQMAIVFAEETKGGSRSIGHAVFGALAIAVIAEVLPVGAALLGIRSLATLTNSSAPLLEVVNQQAGHGLETAVSLGVAVAIFNAVIASMLTVGRVAFSSARDKAWPEPVNRLLGSVHPRTRAPWVATLLLGAGCAAFTALSSLAAVVTFTAVVVLVLYIMVALAAIVSRVRMPQARRPWKMPAWPLPPIVALGFVGLTLWKQTRHDVVISAVIVLAALAYSVLYVRPRRDRRWIPTDVAPAPDDPIPEPEHTGLPA